MSSDDELTPSEVTEFQKSKDNLLEDSRKVFEDVHADFCDIRKILLKFQEWKEKFPDSYCDAYISFCLPKLLNPLIRVQLINWNPLEVGLEEMPWFRAIEEFSDAKNVSESKRDDDTDQEVLPRVIEKTILPKITGIVRFVWDPLSTSQTKNLVQLCNNIFEKQDTFIILFKQDLLNMVVLRLKKSVEEDVFIPLYPKRHSLTANGISMPSTLVRQPPPPRVLYSALGPPTQEGHGPVGASPEEDHEDDQRAGAPLL
uniref:GCF C-terminal domain-containing protein n=1 Tax=Accipiter nisus TaxID=211598 RepID=A0A8B9NLB4_9AVES